MPLLTVNNLTKHYGGVHALSGIEMEVANGEIHALCGENGAGKSTLIKCLAGTVRPNDGSVTIDGRRLKFGSVSESESAGIAVIHQESTAFPDLSAIDNLFVGREFTTWNGWRLDHRRMKNEARDLMAQLGHDIDLLRPTAELSIANRQMISMARALSQKCKLLIMDEPTASLSAREASALLQVARRLRKSGVSILYVSHRLEEVFEIADRVTIFRDGEKVATRPTSSLNRDSLVHLMVGRDIAKPDLPNTKSNCPEDTAADATPVLQIEGLSRFGAFRNVSFSVGRGEVVGLAGLVGAGRSEVARAIFGIDAYDAGTVKINTRELQPKDPQTAVKLGVALVPEDRQHEGLVLPMTTKENISFAILRQLTRFGLISDRKESALVEELAETLHVKMASQDAPSQTLSGGNQQKLVLAKWLATHPYALILDEPTRGVDVGAKEQVHRLIHQLADNGMATLVISSDLPELLSLCDRILIMREGEIVDEITASEATENRVLQSAFPQAEQVN